MSQKPWQVVMQGLRRLVQPADAEPATDRALLSRFARDRDEAAFSALVERHGPLVLRVCRQVLGANDAEDAFQATFCVLAKKAGMLLRQGSIAGWLYVVARRVARKARAAAQLRQLRERDAARMNSTDDPAPDPMLRALLDDELERLPEKYRAPLILCYLEGQTNEEAAQSLGWPKGTVQGRLARARDLLKNRLTRRGIALAAVLTLLETPETPAALPAPLTSSTLQLVLAFAADAPVSPSVAALAEGVLRTMWLTKVKIAALLFLLASVGLGAAGFLFGGGAQPPAPVLSVPVAEEPQAVPTTAVPFPDGLASADGTVAYVTNAEGKIDALNLATGKTFWTSASIGRPLLVADGKLYIQTEAIDTDLRGNRVPDVVQCRIGVLDLARKGKLLLESEPIRVADVSGAYGNHFHLSGARLEASALIVIWRSSAAYWGPPQGFAISEKEQARRARTAIGTAEVNLETGRVALAVDHQLEQGKWAAPPGTSKELLPIYEKCWGMQWPVVVGDRLVAVEVLDDGKGPWKWLLRSWDRTTGKEAAPVKLAEGPNGTRYPSPAMTLDRRHVLLEDQGSVLGVFTLPEGQRVDNLSAPLNGRSPPALYTFGLFEVQYQEAMTTEGLTHRWEGKRTLRCLDVKNGKVRWESPLRGEPRCMEPPVP